MTPNVTHPSSAPRPGPPSTSWPAAELPRGGIDPKASEGAMDGLQNHADDEGFPGSMIGPVCVVFNAFLVLPDDESC